MNEISWFFIGHMVCVSQWAAFLLVDRAYLGKGRVKHVGFWSVVLVAGMLAFSLIFQIGFFTLETVWYNVGYVLLSTLLFGGTLPQKLTAALINGTMCLLSENTVRYVVSWVTGTSLQVVWQRPGCLVTMTLTNLIVGVVVAMMVAMVLLGGVKRIGSVTEKLVPFMALFYVVLALGVVVINYRRFPAVLASIVGGAFDPQAFTGGAIGSIFLSMQKGVSRGIFSNEAGLGTGSIAHACADTKKPVKQGMFGIFEVFADTIVICTLTAMVILCSGTTVNYGTAAGAELTISGFTTTYGGWASIFTAVALCCFAFSTIIGWGLYGSRFLVFLCRSDKVAKPFFLVYSFVSILGATMDLGLLWSIADTFNGLMSIPNLLALLLLSGTVVRLTKEFFASEG